MKIYNSLTRKKEEFITLKAGKVSMYVCGPTVYDEPHIGHARSAYIFDVIRRYLKYKGYEVTFVRNVTDVDDKIIDKAKKERPGEDLNAASRFVAAKYLDSYHRDMGALGIMPPDMEPRATEYVSSGKMQKFIEALIENGFAYASGGDVYFDIRKCKGYGKLSNQSLDKMEVGSRVSPGEKKRDGLDFALWKSAKEGEPSWPSPWGAGRPGWHIECSVMSQDTLGDEFDIHGGGIDLIFPHHENEIAQSEGAGKRFARYWIHNGLLTINNEKMAKSLGNYITIVDFISKYRDGDLLKLLFLSTHYRHPVDYTPEKMVEMKKEKERFVILFDKMDKILKDRKPFSGRAPEDSEPERIKMKFVEAMEDDLNTPLALASIFDLVTCVNRMIHNKSAFSELEIGYIARAMDSLLSLSRVFGLDISKAPGDDSIDPARISGMIEERDSARRDKDFKKADDIRKELDRMGVVIEDSKSGTQWRKKI